VKVDIYSDVTCPWCYVGTRRFAAAVAQFAGTAGTAGAPDVEIEWKPFQLDPSAPVGPVPLPQALAATFGTEEQARAAMAHVAEVATIDGITLDHERALSVNTFTAYRLLWLARQKGVQAALVERLFAAFHCEGADLSDHATLTALAADAGLDGVADFLSGDAGVEEVKEAIGEARAVGIESVPTYVFDERWAVSGAQTVDVFQELLQQVTDATISATGSGCCGGGCCG
jgi:predicted DsbA family dithiol-disulfide isomerase